MQIPLPVQNISQFDYSRLFDTKRSFRLLEILPESDSGPHASYLTVVSKWVRFLQETIYFAMERLACTESVRCSVATLPGGSSGILVNGLSIHPSE